MFDDFGDEGPSGDGYQADADTAWEIVEEPYADLLAADPSLTTDASGLSIEDVFAVEEDANALEESIAHQAADEEVRHEIAMSFLRSPDSDGDGVPDDSDPSPGGHGSF